LTDCARSFTRMLFVGVPLSIVSDLSILVVA